MEFPVEINKSGNKMPTFDPIHTNDAYKGILLINKDLVQ